MDPNAHQQDAKSQHHYTAQLGDSASVRVTVEKPITEPIVRISTAPADYLLQSAGEETPKYNEFPGAKGEHQQRVYRCGHSTQKAMNSNTRAQIAAILAFCFWRPSPLRPGGVPTG